MPLSKYSRTSTGFGFDKGEAGFGAVSLRPSCADWWTSGGLLCPFPFRNCLMRLLPGRGRLMVGPNLSQFEFLSAACELWLLGLRRVRLPVALTPHPKDPRLGKLLACFCLFTGFCTLHAWPNHWVIFGFQLQAIPVSIGPITYFQSQA